MKQIGTKAEALNLFRDSPEAQLLPDIFLALLSVTRPIDSCNTLNTIILQLLISATMAWFSFQYFHHYNKICKYLRKPGNLCFAILHCQSHVITISNAQPPVDNTASINKMNCNHIGFHKTLSLCWFFTTQL